MMNRLRSSPPYTVDSRRPARCAMSVKRTAHDSGCGDCAAMAQTIRSGATRGTMAMSDGPRRVTAMSAARLPLEPLGDGELFRRIRRAAGPLIHLAEQVVRGAVVRVVLDRSRQHALGRRQVALLQVGLAEHDVGGAVERVDPQRFLQRRDPFVLTP